MRNHILPILLLLFCPALAAAEPIALRAGPMTMVFEPENAFLRYIKVGEHEVLRGINAPIRDEFWGTVQPKLFDFQAEVQEDQFEITFLAKCIYRDVDFRWHGTIRGSSDGRVEWIFDGEAHSNFKRNRIGFCVLHGPAAAGQAWKAVNPQGMKSTGNFPTLISPHQPVKNLRSITHQLTPNVWAKVEFEGEVFEMEDQRNWTDASFKTYCTPLAIPYPVQVNKGDKVYQRIVISLEGDLEKVEQQEDGEYVVLELGEKLFRVPKLGLQVSSEVKGLSEKEIERLKALKLDHLYFKLDLAEKEFANQLHRAVDQAESLGIALHVGLQLGENPEQELRDLVAELKENQTPISVWVVNEADESLFNLARKYLEPFCGNAQLGISQDTNFVELNRNRPTDDRVRVVSFGVNPQIHAIDNASIIETLPIQGDAVRSAQEFLGDRKLIVGPITFKPQPINQQPAAGELPSNVDIRQPSLFVGGWTLGSIKYLAEANTDRATYFETVGWKGIMEGESIPSRIAKFPSRAGEVFASYHVLRDIADFAEGEMVELSTTDALSVVGMALTEGDRTRLLVANLTKLEQSVAIFGVGKSASVRSLTAENLAEANSDPEVFHDQRGASLSENTLVLAPFEIVRIDWAID